MKIVSNGAAGTVGRPAPPLAMEPFGSRVLRTQSSHSLGLSRWFRVCNGQHSFWVARRLFFSITSCVDCPKTSPNFLHTNKMVSAKKTRQVHELRERLVGIESPPKLHNGLRFGSLKNHQPSEISFKKRHAFEGLWSWFPQKEIIVDIRAP